MHRGALFLFVGLLAAVTSAWSAEGYSLNNGVTKQITEHGVCRMVTNAVAGGLGVYVPTKFDVEWSVGSKAFINNVISGVSLAACLDAASLRFRGSQYLNRTPASAGNQQKWTWSGWLKRSGVATQQTVFEASPGNGSDREFIFFNSAGMLHLGHYNGGWTYVKASTALYRDTSAWMHVVVAVDSTQATGALRTRIYVNGTELSSWSSSVDMALNRSTNMNSTKPHFLGRQGASSEYFEGNLADVYLVDGQQLAPSDFAELDANTNQWIPKSYAGTYGTNGFHLTFANPASLGNDSSGNAKHWTPNNFSTTTGTTYDPMGDYASGSLGGNYATLNSADGTSNVAFANGNLQVTGSAFYRTTRATIGVTSGKWYWEVPVTTFVNDTHIGVGNENTATYLSTWAGTTANGWVYTGYSGNKFNSNVGVGYGSAWTTNDVIGVALDATANSVWFSKNGAWQNSGNPAAGTGAAYTSLTGAPYYPIFTTGSGSVLQANFGQRAFAYTPPTGFNALNTANLPAPAIVTATDYFKTVTYTGNGLFRSIGTPPKLSGGKSISNSVMMRTSATRDFTKTFTTPTNSKKYTYSTWVKRSANSGAGHVLLVGGAGTSYALAFDGSSILGSNPDSLVFVSSNGGATVRVQSKAYFLDPTQWINIIMAVDTTQATAADRVKFYANGRELSILYTTYPALNADTGINTASAHRIGSWGPGSLNLDGYLAEMYFVDGQALTPSSFGQLNDKGAWVPVNYSGTYGANGFYLNFTNGGAFGTDSSGNGNAWTANNFIVEDLMLDTPTRNFATYSIADKYSNFNVNTGALYAWPSTGNTQLRSTLGVTSGKWYWEVLHGGTAVSNYGVATPFTNLGSWGGSDAYGWAYHASNGQMSNNGTVSAYGSAWGSGHVMGVALDADSGKVWFSKNNVWQLSGNPAAGTNPTYSNLTTGPFYATFGGNTGGGAQINFGQGGLAGLTYDAASGGSFFYTPPAGFLALNTANISNTDFVPDLVWIKSRSAATDHAIYDGVRGATIDLVTNSTAAETAPTNGLLGFNGGGFNIGTLAKLNTNAATYVAWMFKEGVTPGFDVVSYTGTGSAQNVPHGLSAKPAMIIEKDRQNGTGYNWGVYHQNANATPQNYYLQLNTSNGAQASSAMWNNTAPTASVFTVATDAVANASGHSYVAYVFAEVPGFSKFGGYTGNGAADGTFVYTGFRPAFVMTKRTDSTSNWYIRDSARSTYNPSSLIQAANGSGAEESPYPEVDFLSNGFKFRGSNTNWNASAGTYIYAAFAEQPFKYATAR